MLCSLSLSSKLQVFAFSFFHAATKNSPAPAQGRGGQGSLLLLLSHFFVRPGRQLKGESGPTRGLLFPMSSLATLPLAGMGRRLRAPPHHGVSR